MNDLPFWIAFNVTVLTLLALDLFVFHRHAREVSVREAACWTAFWITLSLLFNLLVWRVRGPDAAMEFLLGYLVEYSLSVDNIFIFVLIFAQFRVPPEYQHRVLFWGILGALVMRGIMIGFGAALVSQFHWILYIFGAFLLFVGIRMLLHKETDALEVAHNPIVRFISKRLPMTPEYNGQHFTIRRDGRLYFTPLALVLVMVETTDLMFAVDSIPAIFGITTDTFIVYTSNVCAILGLRSLYFFVAGAVKDLVYLKYGLGVVLAFIGGKMLAEIFHLEIPHLVSLAIVVGTLATSVVASLIHTRRARRREKDAA